MLSLFHESAGGTNSAFPSEHFLKSTEQRQTCPLETAHCQCYRIGRGEKKSPLAPLFCCSIIFLFEFAELTSILYELPLCKVLGKIQKSYIPSLFETFFALLSGMEHPDYEHPKILRDPNPLKIRLCVLFRGCMVYGIFRLQQLNLQSVMEFSELSFLGM